MENHSKKLLYCSICWQKSRNHRYCHHCGEWDYGKCYDCGEQQIEDKWCQNCKPLEITPTFALWTSGNDEIDQLIQKNQLIPKHYDYNCWRWIDYDGLDNIEYLSEGGYGTVYKAVWNNMPEEIKTNYSNPSKMIAMKKLNDSQNFTKDFTNEIKAYHKNNHSYIIPIFGITQVPMTKEYAIVMKYCDKGDLKRIMRQKYRSLNWGDKLSIIISIIRALIFIHKNGYVHCDIHPGNILKNGYYTYLSDLGLCKPANYESKSNEIYGIIPYMAPEVLRGNPFTPASDIYSLGMIMWELTSRNAPFGNRSHDAHLIIDICKGIRPLIVKGTPEIYVNLMKSCWQNDPSKRPTSEEIYDIMFKWWLIDDENLEIDKIFKKIRNTKKNPETYYVSRPLSKHINAAKSDIREGDSAIEWPDSNSVNVNETSEELKTNNSNSKLAIPTQHPEAYDISKPLSKHSELFSRDIREDDLAIEWPDSNSVIIKEIIEELTLRKYPSIKRHYL
ncbi:hypothetical protein Glove_350g158 [Diversispora epigaea]|uniref:Protein kinase domain-containing protein n=1 Tax=Diversispora epigaea TaxID=1348612 RepID=A0A397HI62_9GLOM|nr:hypothetical protein Glove_350g158 [Diversispora epigaea]